MDGTASISAPYFPDSARKARSVFFGEQRIDFTQGAQRRNRRGGLQLQRIQPAPGELEILLGIEAAEYPRFRLANTGTDDVAGGGRSDPSTWATIK